MAGLAGDDNGLEEVIELQPMEQTTPQTTLTHAPRAAEALSVRRLFTRPGVHPFETVEWEEVDDLEDTDRGLSGWGSTG